MPNQAKGEVHVEWDKKRTLLFSFETMVAIEEMTGLDLLIKSKEQGMRVFNALRQPNMSMLRAMVFGLLAPTDPTMTKAKAGEILMAVGPMAVFPGVMEAVALGMDAIVGAKGSEATPDPPAVSPSPGSVSGASPDTI